MHSIGRFMLCAVLLTACASGHNDNNNQEADAGPDAGATGPVLQSVTPASGPLAGGTHVGLSGQRFVEGMTVTFGGNAATAVDVLSADRATCLTPAGDAAGAVTVRVENPDAQSSQLIGAFTYHEQASPDVTWCRLQRPATTDTEVQVATAPIYGQVFAEGLTDQVGKGSNVTGQLGYGPVGTDPDTSAEWIWTPAVYSGDASTVNDEYVASLTVPTAGTYDYAFRFSGGGSWLVCDLDSSDNGYDSDQAGTLTVTEGTEPLPDWCGLVQPLSTQSVAGDPTETITGQVLVTGVTDTTGAGADVTAELGYGPAGTNPGVDPGWHFSAGSYSGDVGNNDEYEGTVTVAGPGSFDYAWRFRKGTGPWLYCDSNGSTDGYSASYAGHLTVTGQPSQTVDWCNLQYPASTSTPEGVDTELLFGRVYAQGLTEGNGQGMGILAEVGYGDTGSDPASDSSWQWETADYNISVDGLISGDLANDEYMATLNVATAGTYDYAFRFSADNGTTWLYCDLDGAESASEYSPAQAGALTVTASGGFTLTDVDPPAGSLLGGDTVTLTGTGFTASTTVSFGTTASPSVTFVSATELTAEVPAGALGTVDVTVENPGPTQASLTDGFEYVRVFTPTVDGALSDWDSALVGATNSVTTDWTNATLSTLYVAFDDTNLYLGIEGTVDTNQALVGYLDIDYGQSTGVADMSNITDGTGNLDAALSGVLDVTATGFGAEFAFGSKEMNEVINGLDDAAGWRSLSNPADLAWLTGTVDAGTGVLELSIPIATLWPSGVPAGGATAAVVVKIADYEGAAYANQTLPEEDTGATVSQVFTFRIRPASEI